METIITKSYQGAQTRLLLPKVKDVAGVIGDNNSTRLCFKLPKVYETGWAKYIEFDCYVTRDDVELKPTYLLDENDSFVIPYEITESNIGKEVDYNLKFVSNDGEIIEKSEMATLYFRDSSNGTIVSPDPYTDVITFLYSNAFCNVSYSDGTTIGEGSEQLPKLTFTPMNPTGEAEELSLNIPYLDENGVILNKFINKEIVIEIFKIASSNDLIELSTAQAPDMALVSLANPSNPEYMNLYMLVGNNPANIDNWYLIHTDSPIFKTVNVSGDVNVGGVSTLTSVVTESLTFDDPNLSEKVLITDSEGTVTTDSSLTLDELHALVGVTDNIQEQINTEIHNRQNEDIDIRSDLDDEAQTRHNDDVALQGAINTEVSDRQNAISQEAQARQNAIASEAEERRSEDNALGVRIDKEKVDRENADYSLEALIQTEADERQAADAELLARMVEKISPSPAGEGFVKVDVNEQGQVINHYPMVESDIPTLSISKTNGLQTALNNKLDDNQLVDEFAGHITDDTYIPSAKLVSTSLATKVDKTFDSTLFDGASFPSGNVTDSAVSIRFTTKDTNNNIPGTLDVPLPVASGGANGRAGIATKAQIDQIEQNRQDIALLSGKSSRYAINVDLSNKTPSEIQTALTSAWRTASGQSTGNPDEYTTLVNLWNNHEYTWLDVGGTESWVDRGISTVSTATNSSLGVVMGTPDPQDNSSNGRIFVEPNGTMTVLGWDDITTAVSNNASDISSLQLGKVDKLTTSPAGTYPKVTVNAQGQVTSGTTLSASDIPSLSWNKITSDKPTTLSGYGITDAVQSNTAITGATKCKITYDTKGLVTGGGDLSASDIPALAISKITNLQTSLDNKLDGFIITFAGNWSGGVHPVNCVTVDYSTCNSENGVFIKFSIGSSHGNGQAFRYLEDAIFNVKYTGEVEGTLYRYFAEKIVVTGEYNGMYYGDVFWTIDTTNKIVKFYVLMGQYAYSRMTTYFRLNQSTGGTITQSSGQNTAYEYSTGTKNWALVEDFSTISDKYVKPSTGIPKTDLASAVQTSLDKADTALQSHQSIKTINSTSVVGTGNINLQVPLVGSGTYQNIKTVGGTNILGTGDINPVTKTAIESALNVSATYNNQALIVKNGVLDFGEAGKVDEIQINGTKIAPLNDSKVANIVTGTGLTSSSNTIKVKLASETNATDPGIITHIQGKQYAVVPETNGYLSVNVPWTDTQVRQVVADGSDDTNRAVLLSGFSNTETVEYLDSYTVQSKKIYASDVTGTITAPHFYNSTTSSSLDFIVGSITSLTEVN